jgi:arylsulfatase A-like enzyme
MATEARAVERPAQDRRPNVLFLLTDDQRADTIHALGNPVIQTPNLDRLARSGLVFRNAYCMGGDMSAVCFPSRSMLLSGLSLFHLKHQKGGYAVRYDVNFPKTLREAGYETYHHGKRQNGPTGIYKDFEHEKYLVDDTAERLSGRPGKEIADAAVTFLKSRDQSRPFFAYLAFGNPHDPRVVIREYRDRYNESKLPLPANYLPLHPFNNGWLTGRDERLADWPRTEAEIRKHLTDYYGVITYLDEQIGRILQALEESGQSKNTIIIFSSDHGLAMGSHGLMGKQNLYEVAMKPPLIFAGPGIRIGESESLVYLHDIFPTVCELVGVTPPAGLDARSFAAVLSGKSDSAREAIFLAFMEFQRAVRQGDWKLIRYPQVNIDQLFNLRDDPYELHNLSQEQPERTRVLSKLLRTLQKANDDTLPLTVKHPKDPAVTAQELREQGRQDAQALALQQAARSHAKKSPGEERRQQKKIVFIAGKPSHGYGAHEHRAGCLLLAKALNENVPSVHADVVTNGWPRDPHILDDADCIVIYADGGAGHPLVAHLDEFDRLMKQGIGLVCIHYAVEIPAGKPGQRMEDWTGGYFELNWSVNPHWTAHYKQLPEHEITRGVKPFTINDEWYYHMRFLDGADTVTPILSDHPPADTLKNKDGIRSGNKSVRAAIAQGEPQTMAWARQRPDGGRGFGITGGHFHWNWGNDNFRKLVLNAIVWAAHVEVPPDGVPSRSLTLEDLEANQDDKQPANFNPNRIRALLKQWHAESP